MTKEDKQPLLPALLFAAIFLLALSVDGIAGDAPRAEIQQSSIPIAAHTLRTERVPTPEPLPAPDIDNPTPLSDELFSELLSACSAYDVPIALALGVMEQESGFDEEAVSPSGCYGLCQLNPDYFPADLTPAENIRAGVGYIGELLSDSDTTAEAVTAYFYGPSDRTSSWYSDEVLGRMAAWETTLK